MSLRDATRDSDKSLERRDIVTREVMDESRLIRFVAGPDGAVVPDLGRRLPGRGMWVAADRASVETAASRNLFARAAKAQIKAPADLADMVERLLARRCLDQLGLARREGVLISGFEKSMAALRGGRIAWLIEASDGSADGRAKLTALARRQSAPPQVCGAFTADDLSLALGLENAIHAVLPSGGRADRWTIEVERLAGFRPLRPRAWDQGRPGDTHGSGSGEVPKDGSGDGSDKVFDGRGSAS